MLRGFVLADATLLLDLSLSWNLCMTRTPEVVCVLSGGGGLWTGAKAGSICVGGLGLQYGLS